jgi:nitrate/nitrite transporter NarK
LGGLSWRIWLRYSKEKMTTQDFFGIWLGTIGVIGGLSGFVITHLLAEIKRLNSRVDEIYNILLERQ